MRSLILAAIAFSLAGCIGVGRRCTRFYGVAVPFVRVGVTVPCDDATKCNFLDRR